MIVSLLFLGETARAGARERRESFETLYALYHGTVLRYLEQLCGSHDQAEELAQETFVRAYTGLLAFRGDSSAATWLFRIARNAYLDSLRQPAVTHVDTSELLLIPDTTGDGDPVRRYAEGEQRDLIARTLRELPELQRSVLLLRDAEGLAYVEIADVLGLSVAAVRIRLFRARNAFRQIYRQLEDGEGDGYARL